MFAVGKYLMTMYTFGTNTCSHLICNVWRRRPILKASYVSMKNKC